VRLNPRAVITGVLFVAIIGLAIWCLARPEPLLVQGESGEHADRHRTKQLAAHQFAAQSKLDEDADALTLAVRGSIRQS